jgi:hypothetical protein
MYNRRTEILRAHPRSAQRCRRRRKCSKPNEPSPKVSAISRQREKSHPGALVLGLHPKTGSLQSWTLSLMLNDFEHESVLKAAYARFATITFCLISATASLNSVTLKYGCHSRFA